MILAVALAKAVETLSDIHYGLFQLNDRLDQTGRSMMLRGVLSVSALAITLYFIPDVFWGCMCVALAWALALVLFDVRRGRRLLACTESPGESSGVSAARAPSIAGSAARDCYDDRIHQSPHASLFRSRLHGCSTNWESSRRWLTPLSH